MKHLKKFEGVWSKNIKVGEIYKISEYLLPMKRWNNTIDLAKVIDIFYYEYDKKDSINYIDIKTFIKETGEEFIMEYAVPKILLKKATKEDVERFHRYEINLTSKNYNL